MIKWKFLMERDGRIESYHGNQSWRVGEWVDYPHEITLYSAGLHASPNPPMALGYVKGNLLAQVEVRGESIETEDKSVHSSMRLTRVYRWSKEDSVALAIFAAELVIDIFETAQPGDDCPRKAIEAARAWLAAQSVHANAARAANYAHAAAVYAAHAAVYAAHAAAYAAEAANYAAHAHTAANYAEAAVESAVAAYIASRRTGADGRSALTARAEIREQISEWMIARTAQLPEWSGDTDTPAEINAVVEAMTDPDEDETFNRFADEDEATKAESIARTLELLKPLTAAEEFDPELPF